MTRRPPGPDPAQLRPLWSGRAALGEGVSLVDERERTLLLVPRRGRIERLFARLLHGADTRIRLEVPTKAAPFLERLSEAAQPVPVEVLGREHANAKASGADPDLKDPATVAFLVFLQHLVRGGAVRVEMPR